MHNNLSQALNLCNNSAYGPVLSSATNLNLGTWVQVTTYLLRSFRHLKDCCISPYANWPEMPMHAWQTTCEWSSRDTMLHHKYKWWKVLTFLKSKPAIPQFFDKRSYTVVTFSACLLLCILFQACSWGQLSCRNAIMLNNIIVFFFFFCCVVFTQKNYQQLFF